MFYLLRIAIGLLLVMSIGISAARGQGHENNGPSRNNLSTAANATGLGERARNLLTADQQSAIWQLEQLVDSTKEFSDETLKIKAQAQIADALWTYDEPRARNIFDSAFRKIESLEPSPRVNGASESQSTDFARLYSLKFKLRNEVILLITRHDSRMADDLVKSLAQSASDANTPSATANSAAASHQAILYMQLAMRLAQTDPQEAARLVRLSLDSGINPMLPPVLAQIRSHDPTLSDELFAYALMVAQKETVSLTEGITWMAPYLLPSFERAPPAVDERAPERDGFAGSSQPNPVLIARYLEFAGKLIITQLNTMQARAANNPSAMMELMSDYRIGQTMLPFFEQFAPGSAATLRARLEGIADFNSSMNAGGNMETNSQSPNLQDLIKDAEAAQNISQKDALYARAAVMAAQVDDFETALSLTGRISDEPRRNNLESAIRYRAAQVAINKGKFELAYQHGKDISDLKQHAFIIGRIMTELYKRGQSNRAVEMLDEAAKFVMDGKSGPEQVQAMLTLTESATRFDSARGFELMALALQATNSAAFSRIQNNAGQAEKNLAGEEAPTSEAYAELVLNLDRSLAPLVQFDFNRALLLAQSLRKKELSAFAQLTVCRAELSLPSKSKG